MPNEHIEHMISPSPHQQTAGLVEIGFAIALGDGDHRIRRAVAGYLHADDIVTDIDRPYVLLVLVVHLDSRPRPFCVEHLNFSFHQGHLVMRMAR